MNCDDMKGKTVVITGGSRGVGRAIARRFASAGAETVAIGRSETNLAGAVDALKEEGLTIHPCQCDISHEDQIQSAVSGIFERFGKVDVLINNAGVGFRGEIETMPVEVFDNMMNVNIRGMFLMTKYILPSMKKRQDGCIINVSSGAGLNGIAGLSGYCASKFAVRGFTQALAQEAKPYKIKVSALFPGSINTDFQKNFGNEPGEEHLMNLMQPEDIAETVFHMTTRPLRYWIFEVTQRSLLI